MTLKLNTGQKEWTEEASLQTGKKTGCVIAGYRFPIPVSNDQFLKPVIAGELFVWLTVATDDERSKRLVSGCNNQHSQSYRSQAVELNKGAVKITVKICKKKYPKKYQHPNFLTLNLCYSCIIMENV